ncbi:MAG: 3'-5' exonuclease [Candidatus Cloacimonadota bacterium]|nr:MAG: 3'-5' exonuclease [Candidatus Cloacimonadota bacterium]
MGNTDKIYVKELSEHINKEVISSFLVTHKELREGANNLFIRLKLGDRTGQVVANIWKNAANFNEMFAEGDIIEIKGIVILYKGQVQVTVNKLHKLNELQCDLSDYVQTAERGIQDLAADFFKFIDSVQNPHLNSLLKKIFDEDKEFFAKFAKTPAAKSWHHNYMGGLLEHSLAVASICNFCANLYPVDRDLLVTGALLHDIGKMQEYNVQPSIEFSDIGRLIGHICLGDQLIYETASKINLFPKDLLMKLRHLILSHHGEYEKAAARLPQMLEATVLHFADNMDAQSAGITQLIKAAENNVGKWTEFDKFNNRYYYLG